MKKNMSQFILVLVGFFWLMSSTASAQQGGLPGRPAPAARQVAVRKAVQAVYANPKNTPAMIQAKLSAILAEAEATGNQLAISDTIQAVMQGAVAQGAEAVGQAAQTCASVVYAANLSPANTQNQLSAIISGAAKGGGDALRSAIVGVLTAGGTQNIEVGKAAINNSPVPPALQRTIPNTIAQTVPMATNPAPITPPRIPGTPATPGTPGTSGTPGTPGTPGKPGTPGMPPGGSYGGGYGGDVGPDVPPVDNKATPT